MSQSGNPNVAERPTTHETATHFDGRRVTGPNTALGKGAPEITCLSCQPHHFQRANPMLPDVPNRMAVCETSHKFY